jgi:hypothetical protein
MASTVFMIIIFLHSINIGIHNGPTLPLNKNFGNTRNYVNKLIGLPGS